MVLLFRHWVQVQTYNGQTWIEWSFLDVWFRPDGALNLFSVKNAGQKGVDQDIRNDGKLCTILKDGEPIGMAVSPGKGNLYRMAVRVVVPERMCVADGSDNTLQAWHERLGHQDKRHVKVSV